MGRLLILSSVGVLLFVANRGRQSPPSLPGTTWAASYYHYHEDWTFISTDSVTIRSGQWGWSMPVEPTLISQDSLYLYEPEGFHYRLVGELLIVLGRYDTNEEDTLTWDGDRFRSNWMFTYGHVVLFPGGNTDCRLHD